MPKILIIFLIIFFIIIKSQKFVNSSNFISSQLIIDYFQKDNLCIRVNNQNLLKSESNIKKLYKYLRSYINQIYWKNLILIPKDKILEIIVIFNEETQDFSFESYFSEKEIYSDILYV